MSLSPIGLPSLLERYADQMLDFPLVDLLALSHRRYFPLAKVLPLMPYVCFRFFARCFSSLVGFTVDDAEAVEGDAFDNPSDNCCLKRPKVLEILKLFDD